MHDFRPAVEPHRVVRHAAVKHVAVELREILERGHVVARLKQPIRTPLGVEPARARHRDRLVRIVGQHGFLPVVIDADLVRAPERFAVGEVAVVANAEFLQLLSELCRQDSVCRAQAVGNEGVAAIR